MSIQIGTYDLIADPRNRVFNNERIKLYSDIQSNLIELASSCNETTILIDQIQFGASNNNSNFFIDTYIYGSNTFRLFDISRNASKINTDSLVLSGNLTISSNITIVGGLVLNQTIQSPSINTSNIAIYANYTNNKPLFLSSNNIDLFALQTNTNRLLIQPNVGIGTTIPKYKLHVEGNVYTPNTLYVNSISSNIGSDIIVYGNLDVRGTVTAPQGASYSNTNLDVAGININNILYETKTGLLLNQAKGQTPLVVVNTKNNDNSTTTVFGVSSSGRVYIGADVSNQAYINSLENSPSNVNAIFSISMPNTYLGDQLFKANGYNTSNQFMISSNAYIGIGTTMINHPIHVYIQSNVNVIHSLSNMASIGLYHSNMENKPFIIGYSNNTAVFTVSPSGSVSIGSNTAIFLSSNGVITTDRLISSNILFYNSIAAPTNNINLTRFNTIESTTLVASNIFNSNLSAIGIQNSGTIISSNINTNVINVTNNAIMNDLYVAGSLSGPSITTFTGTSTGSEFIPAAEGVGSITYLRSSNVLISTNSTSYSSELNGAIAGLSNGVLQVKTYPLGNKPIATGVSVYGSDRSGILVTANKPYYQLQRGTTAAYNIGINASDEMYFGSSNGTDTDYTLTSLKLSSSTVTVGSSKTFLYTNANGSILVSTAGNNSRELDSTGGFEVRGYSYFRTGAGSAILYMNGANANIGIGYTTPRKTLDVVGDVIVSTNIGIGTTLPISPLHVQGITYLSTNVGIGTTITRSIFEVNGSMISTSVGIGTTLIRKAVDVAGDIITSTNIGIGTTLPTVQLHVIGSNLIIGSSTTTNQCSASNFIGSGANLTNLNASNINAGAIDATYLPITGVSAGTYGSGTLVPVITVDTKGRVTSVSNVGVSASGGSTQWTTSNTNIYVTGSNVGIGTTIPRSDLDVVGNIIVSSSNINNVNINSLDRRTKTNFGPSNTFVDTWYTRGSTIYQSDWTSVCWASEIKLFCGVAYNTGNTTANVITSSDSYTWTVRTGATNNQWTSVCWAPELYLFCAVANSGTGNRVMTSGDGITWTSRTSAADNEWNSICWSSDLRLFCAVSSTGSGNRVMTSPNGTTWTSRTSAADNEWTSVCWASELKLFCAVSKSGTGNRVMTSPDGITWTSRTSAANSNWYAVCWSPDAYIFCAVGDSGAIMTSRNGITWTTRTSPLSYYWRSICWSSEMNMFCVVGTTGTVGSTNKIIISPDGINWTSKSDITNENWNSICWSPELSIFAGISRITFDTGTWDIVTTVYPGDGNEQFGFSLEMSEDGLTFVAGAPFFDAGPNEAGCIHVYTRSKTQNTIWSSRGQYTASDATISDRFGWSVSISKDGTTIAVGAPYNDTTTTTNHGSVYIFTRTGAHGTAYAQQVNILNAGDVAASDLFGKSVSLNSDGTILAVGAPLDDLTTPSTITDAGSVYIFTRSANGNNSWTQLTRIQASDAAASDQFGASVSLSSDATTLAVGAPVDDISTLTNAGSVYIFTRTSTTWTQLTRLQASDANTSDQFGNSVSLNSNGTALAVGANLDDNSGGTDTGSVYIFTRSANGNTTWIPQTRLQGSDANTNDQFGCSVSMNSDGTRLAISSLIAGYYFERKADSNWYETNRISSGTYYSSAIDKYGITVAFGDPTSRTSDGQVYTYDFMNDNYITTSTCAMPNAYNTVKLINSSQLYVNQSSGYVGIGNTTPAYTLDVTGNIYCSGYIRPSAGSGNNGIIFPSDPGGGSGDIAYIKYYASSGELTLLDIGVANDSFGTIQDSIRLMTSAGVGINITPSYLLHLATDSAAKPTTSTWIISSDMRIKEDIQNADLDKCYDVVKNLRLCRYGWNSNYMPNVNDRHMLGWIAQEVEPLIPNAVTRTSNYGFSDLRGLDSDQIIKFMYGALQKLQKISEEQAQQIQTQQEQINTLTETIYNLSNSL